jgi:hypothetical protein
MTTKMLATNRQTKEVDSSINWLHFLTACGVKEYNPRLDPILTRVKRERLINKFKRGHYFLHPKLEED